MASSSRKGKGKARVDDDRPITRAPSPSRGNRLAGLVGGSLPSPAVEVSPLIESAVVRLQEQYCISEQFSLFASETDGRMNTPPSGQAAFYVEDLQMGLRFSIQKFVQNILDYYGLSPAQLAPNSVWLIINFVLLCRLLRLHLVLLFFELSSSSDLIRRPEGGSSSIPEKVFSLLSIFHCSFMDGRINSSSLLLSFLEIFFFVGAIHDPVLMTTVE